MIGKEIIELKETKSTNIYAFNLINEKDVDEGTVISAVSQYSGKGTGGNSWESEIGKNLTISIILKPEFLPLEKQFMLNIVASLAVCDMVSLLLKSKEDVKIKWPNDIYVGDKKISGILIENTIVGNTFKYCIIGIGVNINQEVFLSDAPNPVSIKNILNKESDLNKTLEILCLCMNERYNQLKNSEFELLKNDYLFSFYRKDELVKFKYNNNLINAVIKGFSDNGRLILESLEKEIIECNFGEIEFVI